MDALNILIMVKKDLTLFFRNRLFSLIPLLTMLIFAVAYFLLPTESEDGLRIGVAAPEPPQLLIAELARRTIAVEMVADAETLFEQVRSGDLEAGLVLSSADLAALAAGRELDLQLYLPASAPREFGQSLALFIKTAANDAAYSLSGQPLNLSFNEQVIGPDLLSGDVSPRDRLLPMFVLVLLISETMGLAALVNEEIERRTLRALLLTPLNLGEFFTSKGIAGVGLAFVQAALLLAITGGLWAQPLLLLAALLVGALLITGTGFLIAAVSKNMMSVIAWGTLVLLVLGVPAFNLVFPGTVASWVRLIPTYYLVDALHRTLNFQAGWAAVWQNLAFLLAFGLAAIFAGTFLLRRKLQWT